MNKSFKRLILGIILVVLLFGIISFVLKNDSKEVTFSKTSLIKINLPFGSEIKQTLTINNPQEKGVSLKVFFENLDNIALSKENEFFLGSKEAKEISVEFKGEENAGVYLGNFIIESNTDTEKIPVIIGIEDPDNYFVIVHETIPKYEKIYLGEEFGLTTKVFDLLNRGMPSINSKYFIKNFNDDIFLQGNSNLIVGGSTTQIIDIPKNWETGNYVFISIVESEDTIAFSTYLFSISKKGFDSILNGFDFLIVLTIGMFVLVLIIVLYFIKTRDSLLIQLNSQQNAELRRNIEYIKNSRKSISLSREKPELKKVKFKKLKIIKKVIIKKIKKKQKEQKREVIKLKKRKGKKNVIKTKLNIWKKEGYKMIETGNEVKGVTKKGFNEQIHDWKKGGYDTSFLNK